MAGPVWRIIRGQALWTDWCAAHSLGYDPFPVSHARTFERSDAAAFMRDWAKLSQDAERGGSIAFKTLRGQSGKLSPSRREHVREPT